jgi:hypothetical protein
MFVKFSDEFVSRPSVLSIISGEVKGVNQMTMEGDFGLISQSTMAVNLDYGVII